MKRTAAAKKKEPRRVTLAHNRGSLDPQAKAAVAKGGKHLLAYYQDEIARLRAQAAAADAELKIQLEDAGAAANKRFVRDEIDLTAQANEIGFWKYECERYRDQIVALLRGKAERQRYEGKGTM
jgi:hypothetical protein